jgi:hypothetical protein
LIGGVQADAVTRVGQVFRAQPEMWLCCGTCSCAQNEQEAGELFVDWTSQIHKNEYREGMSIRKAFRNFVRSTYDWLKRWLADLYVIEKTNFSPQPQLLQVQL